MCIMMTHVINVSPGGEGRPLVQVVEVHQRWAEAHPLLAEAQHIVTNSYNL